MSKSKMILYKYKSGSSLDIEALLANELWVSTYALLNDPVDFPIFAKGIKKEIIDDYCEEFAKTHCCLSFGVSPYTKRLWSYYTNGLFGLCIAYNKEKIVNALREKGIAFFEGKVKYDGSSIDMTAAIQNHQLTGIEADAFFHKTGDWKKEKEYRFVFDYDPQKNYYSNEKGFLLTNLIPDSIYIGYRMGNADKIKIRKYCQDNCLDLYEVSPNWESPNNNDYVFTKVVPVQRGLSYNHTSIRLRALRKLNIKYSKMQKRTWFRMDRIGKKKKKA